MSAQRCVFCLDTGRLRPEQILERGEHAYLCAPRGQLVEGCLIIATYRCIGCLARAPEGHRAELEKLRRLVERFYALAYGVPTGTYYEQGRAGGGMVTDATGGFPHHAHLACLPLRLDVHRLFAASHTALGEEKFCTVRSPYVFVDAFDAASGRRRRAVYTARSPERARELERLRLKPAIGRLIGMPSRGDWRVHPGDRELANVIERFREYGAIEGTAHA